MMPPLSRAQNAAMHAAAAGKSIPKKVGKEFTADQKPGSVKKLPKHVRKTAKRAIKRGMISSKAAKKHLGGY